MIGRPEPKHEYEYITDSCRYNVTKGWYEIRIGNIWLVQRILYRTTLCAILNDLSLHPERRNPFDRDGLK